eukprot:792616-Pleurochrysis_carterae.AAC.1
MPSSTALFYKAELIAYVPERKTWLTRASLLWVIRGVSTMHLTLRQLQALSAEDGCEVFPRQSKCDATGEFGVPPQPYPKPHSFELAS